MKREFLQNFKIGDQPLSKEIIDEIMAENGRDIEAAKKPFADYDTIKSQLDEAQKTISGSQGQDIETIKQSAKDWEKKYNDAVAESQRKIADMEFDHALDAAITGSRGRSTKAVRAMLDLDALKASKNQEADIKTALETLQKESGYLFDDGGNPPPYSKGAGTQQQEPNTGSEQGGLAAALRAKYDMKG